MNGAHHIIRWNITQSTTVKYVVNDVTSTGTLANRDTLGVGCPRMPEPSHSLGTSWRTPRMAFFDVVNIAETQGVLSSYMSAHVIKV